MNREVEPHQTPNLLDFPVYSTVRSHLCCLLRSPVYDILLERPQQTQTPPHIKESLGVIVEYNHKNINIDLAKVVE